MRVKALETIAGYYGVIPEGQEASIREGEARELERVGKVVILDENEPATEMPTGKNMTHVRKGKTDGK